MWPVVVSSLSFRSHYKIITHVIFPASSWGSQTTCWSRCGAFEAILLWYKHEKAGRAEICRSAWTQLISSEMWVHILRNCCLIRWRIDSESMCCRLIFTGLFCILLCINTNQWHRFSSQIGIQSPRPGQITTWRYYTNTVQVFQVVWQHVLWYIMWPHAVKTLHRMFSSLIKVILSQLSHRCFL